MKKILLFISVFIISLLLLDIYICNVGAIALSEYEFNSETGIRYRDLENQVLFNEGFSIKSYKQSELYKDVPGFDVDNREKTFKIALIGDSYIKADQVFERQHFGQIIKNKLNIERDVKMTNYAYNGSDFKQMYATQKVIVDPTHPDLIIYFLSSEDFIENKFIDPLLPYIENQDNDLIVINDFKESKIKSYKRSSVFKQYSAITNLIVNAIKQYKTNGILPALLGKLYLKEENIDHNKIIDGSKLLNHKQIKLSKSIEIILEKIDVSKVIFVNRTENKLPDNIMKLICTNNIRLIELSPILGALVNKKQNPYYWKVSNKYGHWNKNAHKEIGIYLSFVLNKMLENKPKHKEIHSQYN